MMNKKSEISIGTLIKFRSKIVWYFKNKFGYKDHVDQETVYFLVSIKEIVTSKVLFSDGFVRTLDFSSRPVLAADVFYKGNICKINCSLGDIIKLENTQNF
jgi:hypothetical protein